MSYISELQKIIRMPRLDNTPRRALRVCEHRYDDLWPNLAHRWTAGFCVCQSADATGPPPVMSVAAGFAPWLFRDMKPKITWNDAWESIPLGCVDGVIEFFDYKLQPTHPLRAFNCSSWRSVGDETSIWSRRRSRARSRGFWTWTGRSGFRQDLLLLQTPGDPRGTRHDAASGLRGLGSIHERCGGVERIVKLEGCSRSDGHEGEWRRFPICCIADF